MKDAIQPEVSGNAREILRARARALSRPPQDGAPATDLLEVLEFRLGKERYAVEVRYVREVYPLKELTPLPGTPSYIPGIVHVRGRILPVFDLKKFFDLPEGGITDLHRIVILQHDDLELGLLADLGTTIRQISQEQLQPSLPTLTGIRSEYLKGVTGDRLVVLDAARILGDPRLVAQEEPDN